MKIKALVFASLATLATGTAFAGNLYRVSATIAHNGTTVATPSLVVRAGASARVEVPGEKGYEFGVSINPSDQNAIDVSTNVLTQFGKMSTSVTTQSGKAMTVSSGDVELTIRLDRVGS